MDPLVQPESRLGLTSIAQLTSLGSLPTIRAIAVVPDTLLELAARKFALLGDPTRLRVVSALHDAAEISVGQLAARTGIPVASVSQHLNRLALGGIVTRRREGTTVRYRIADTTVETLCDLVCASVQAQQDSREQR